LARLVLLAPKRRADATTFEYMVQAGVCDGYAFTKAQLAQVKVGDQVALLRRDGDRRRADGMIAAIVPSQQGRAKNGLTRFDVKIKGFAEVPSAPDTFGKFPRTGVKVLS